MYVNSRDRTLTNATIKKMMFEMRKEDVHGELFMSFYSAENFTATCASIETGWLCDNTTTLILKDVLF